MKFYLHNVENLFLVGENLNHAMRKPEDKVNQLANLILENDPDICMLLEIGGIDSLYHFNSKYLKNLFDVFILPGNSDRGIEMGHLVKKGLPLKFEIKSHRNKNLYGHVNTKFSRDISELIIKKNDVEFFKIFLVHLKSKWDREGNDPGGSIRRKAELITLAKMYQEYQTQNPNVPIIVAGDFNGSAQKTNCEPEFSDLYLLTDLEDCLHSLKIPESDTHTYFQFAKDGTRTGFQLDYIFLPKHLHQYINKEKTGVYRYMSSKENEFLPPLSIYERASLPSDHYPVILDIDFFN